MSEKIQLELSLPPDLSGKRLDAAIAKALPEHSRSRIQGWIKRGQVLVNGKNLKASEKVSGGEKIQINATIEAAVEWVGQDIPLSVLQEDDDIMVINKPAGIVVHPAAGNPDNTLVNALLNHHPALENLPRAGIVHRLDKDTSGCLIVAKTLTAHTSLVDQLQQREMGRDYIALAIGTFVAGQTIDEPIGRHPKNRLKMTVAEDGKSAVTHFTVREKFPAHTLIDIKLETGRTHQIRVHMAHIRHPLVGDKTYGARPVYPKNASCDLKKILAEFPRQALHAIKLSYKHPTSKELVDVDCPLPDDMQNLITACRAG